LFFSGIDAVDKLRIVLPGLKVFGFQQDDYSQDDRFFLFLYRVAAVLGQEVAITGNFAIPLTGGRKEIPLSSGKSSELAYEPAELCGELIRVAKESGEASERWGVLIVLDEHEFKKPLLNHLKNLCALLDDSERQVAFRAAVLLANLEGAEIEDGDLEKVVQKLTAGFEHSGNEFRACSALVYLIDRRKKLPETVTSLLCSSAGAVISLLRNRDKDVRSKAHSLLTHLANPAGLGPLTLEDRRSLLSDHENGDQELKGRVLGLLAVSSNSDLEPDQQVVRRIVGDLQNEDLRKQAFAVLGSFGFYAEFAVESTQSFLDSSESWCVVQALIAIKPASIEAVIKWLIGVKEPKLLSAPLESLVELFAGYESVKNGPAVLPRLMLGVVQVHKRSLISSQVKGSTGEDGHRRKVQKITGQILKVYRACGKEASPERFFTDLRAAIGWYRKLEDGRGGFEDADEGQRRRICSVRGMVTALREALKEQVLLGAKLTEGLLYLAKNVYGLSVPAYVCLCEHLDNDQAELGRVLLHLLLMGENRSMKQEVFVHLGSFPNLFARSWPLYQKVIEEQDVLCFDSAMKGLIRLAPYIEDESRQKVRECILKYIRREDARYKPAAKAVLQTVLPGSAKEEAGQSN
jgi:hypothetical protein